MKRYSALEKKNKNNIATKDISSSTNISNIKNKVTQFKYHIFQHFISPFTMCR